MSQIHVTHISQNLRNKRRMLSLSDVSHKRVLHCLRKAVDPKIRVETPPHILDNFRNTCKRINEQACSMGYDQVEDVKLELTSMYCDIDVTDAYRSRGRPCYSVVATLGFKRPCRASCPHYSFESIPWDILFPPIELPPLPVRPAPRRRPRNQPRAAPARLRAPRAAPARLRAPVRARPPRRHRRAPVLLEVPVDMSEAARDEMIIKDSCEQYNQDLNDEYFSVGCKNGSTVWKFAENTEVLDEMPSAKHFIRRFDESLKRVRSVGVLKLSRWRVDHTIFRFLLDHPKLKNLHDVHFTNCIMMMSYQDFHAFLHSRPIKEIYLSSNFKEFSVDDYCLMNAEKIYMDEYNQMIRQPYEPPVITDILMRKWIEKAPVKIDLLNANTYWKVAGLLDLIKASARSNSTASYKLGKIYTGKKELGMVLSATREIRKLIWTMNEYKDYEDYQSFEVKIRLANNKKFNLAIRIAVFREPNIPRMPSFKSPDYLNLK